jgi:hypothetical protein
MVNLYVALTSRLLQVHLKQHFNQSGNAAYLLNVFLDTPDGPLEGLPDALEIVAGECSSHMCWHREALQPLLPHHCVSLGRHLTWPPNSQIWVDALFADPVRVSPDLLESIPTAL